SATIRCWRYPAGRSWMTRPIEPSSFHAGMTTATGATPTRGPTGAASFSLESCVMLFSLSPVRRGEGRGEGRAAYKRLDASVRHQPLSPALSPDYRGEGVRV